MRHVPRLPAWLLLLSTWIGFGSAQAFEVASLSDIELVIKPEKKTVVITENVRVLVTMNNRSDRHLSPLTVFNLQFGSPELFVIHKGKSRRYRHPMIVDGEADPLRLAPHSSRSLHVELTISAGSSPLFREPGEYEVFARVHARIGHESGKVLSNRTKILVRVPTEREREAVAQFGSLLDFRNINRAGLSEWCKNTVRTRKECFQHIRAFLAEYDDTPWARQLMQALLVNLQDNWFSEFDRFHADAEMYLQRFVDRWPNDPYSWWFRHELIDRLGLIGEYEASKQRLREMRECSGELAPKPWDRIVTRDKKFDTPPLRPRAGTREE